MPPARNKLTQTAELRRSGLDLCDALLEDLSRSGLLTLTPTTLDRLAEFERSLRSYKLSRFASEVSATRYRLRRILRVGGVGAGDIIDRLSRLDRAARKLRSLMDDDQADLREIEEIAGHTWRDGDLDWRENVLLAELAWESVSTEDQFRVDTSYLLNPGGDLWCERKIVPLGVFAKVDDSPKVQRPEAALYPRAGLYPGDLPHRVKLAGDPEPIERFAERIDNAAGANLSLEKLIGTYTARRRRAFPPETMPVCLTLPRFTSGPNGWQVSSTAPGENGALTLAPPPGTNRMPSGESVYAGFEDTVLQEEIEVVLLLLHERDGRLTAAPVGAIVAGGRVRFAM